ncbi:MAG: hypothetical protein Tsb009_36490 [Planctomycetaceae bacterium]
MWIRTIIPFVMLTVCQTPICLAKAKPNPTAEDLKAQTVRLIRQLNAESRRERIRAERMLLNLGPAILPWLPPPELTPNITVREAVRRLRIRLEYRKAEESVRPSYVNLQGAKPLEEILQAISKQTGNQIDFSRLKSSVRKKIVTVNYRRRAFWSVMNDLARRVSLDFEPDDVTGRLVLHATKAGKQPRRQIIDDSTAFLVSVESIKVKPLFGLPDKRLIRVRWAVLSEPRLRPLFLKYSGSDLKLSSGKRQFSSLSPEARYELPLGQSGRELTLQSDFLVDAKQLPTQIQFQGVIQLQTAAGSEEIGFRNFQKATGTAIRRGGVTVTLRKVTFEKLKKDGQRQIRVTVAVSYDAGGPAFESHRTWMFHNRVYLEQKNGKKIPKKGEFQTVLQSDGSVVVAYNFAVSEGAPLPDRFVYVAPTLLINVPVRFTMKNLTLGTSTRGKESSSP